jgi:hypothetical protein
MSKYIDVKRTCWFRYELDDSIELEPIIAQLKNGNDVDAAITECYPDIWDNEKVQYETLNDTEESFSVQENGGQCTVEVYDTEQTDKFVLHPKAPIPIYTNKPEGL